MTEYRDLQILGVGKEPGGRFGRVLIAGSGKILGDVECQEFSIPGSGKVSEGNLRVHGPLTCHGAGKVEGSLQAGSLSVYGAFSVEGDCQVEGAAEIAGSLKTDGTCSLGEARINGSLKTEGGLQGGRLQIDGVLKSEGPVRGEEIVVKGVLKSEANLQAEIFRASGPVTVEGELNAETVELLLTGEDEIESIVGASVTVRPAKAGASGAEAGKGIHLDLNLPFLGNRKLTLNGSLGGSRPHLAAALIEADEIYLENTDCETVRGVKVHIGNECVIDRVEYSGELTTDPYATVGEKVKI